MSDLQKSNVFLVSALITASNIITVFTDTAIRGFHHKNCMLGSNKPICDKQNQEGLKKIFRLRILNILQIRSCSILTKE